MALYARVSTTEQTVEASTRSARLGVQFVSFSESIDTGSPLGQAIFTIVDAMAELERNIIVERVHAGLKRARSQGKRIGRPRAVVDVRLARRLRRQGYRCVQSQTD